MVLNTKYIIYYKYNGIIKGKIVDINNNPKKNIPIYLFSYNQLNSITYTNNLGLFYFGFIPEKYVIKLNL